MSTLPKDLREHMARATGYMQKEDVVAALEAMSLAVHSMGTLSRVSSRLAAEQSMNTLLARLSIFPSVQVLLDPQETGSAKPLMYSHGKEGVLATLLREFAKILQKKQAYSVEKDKIDAQKRLQELLQRAHEAFARHEWGIGNAFLQRAALEFVEHVHIIEHIGGVLTDAQQYSAAGKVLGMAVLKHPKEKALYTAAIEAYMQCEEYGAAEKIFVQALKEFGEHPKTLTRMAHMYTLWKKDDKAQECRLRAQELQK